MRDIRFRAIPFEWDQFVYGSYVEYEGTHYIYTEMYEKATHLGILSQVQIDKSTLGQSTGLRDKNGEMIFEGDILNIFDWGVSYKNLIGKGVMHLIVDLMGDLPRIELFARNKVPGWDSWGNEIESDIIFGNNIEDRYEFCSKAILEIIGNTHENPELLHST